MSGLHSIPVALGGGYRVDIGPGLLQEAGPRLRPVLGDCRLLLLSDSNVAALYRDRVLESLKQAGYDCSCFCFPAGEASKNMETLSALLEAMAEAGLTRQDCLIALGGGVTGDLGGFAAGCYQRGIRYVQLPTTLLAAADSSVGGKTAVDLLAGKNLAGLFHQPSAVLFDTDCLNSLPDGARLCGLAEMLKTAVLEGGSLFDGFRSAPAPEALPGLLARCIRYKARITEADETEQGLRQLLNLGHTPAHAMEVLSGYRLPHGLAVSAGLSIICRASAAMGCCSRETAAQILDAQRACGLPTQCQYAPGKLARAALQDKKRRGDSIRLILVQEIGCCSSVLMPTARLEEIFAAGMEEFR